MMWSLRAYDARIDIKRTFDLFDANHIKSNGTCIRFESNPIRALDSNCIVWGPHSFDWFDSQVAGGSGLTGREWDFWGS
jgi:hypothetical protein